jgi:hypothetical protein
MLNKKGIKEISIVSEKSEVIASSDPRKIGTTQKLTDKKQAARKKDLMITARLATATAAAPRSLQHHHAVAIKGQNIAISISTWHSTTTVSCRTATRSRGSSA